ncbi:MAG: hypothetical protein ABR898_00785 [Terracidiphilus sp.]|jgi:hypothetical protein
MTTSGHPAFTAKELPAELQFHVERDSASKTGLLIAGILFSILFFSLFPLVKYSPLTFAACEAIVLAAALVTGIGLAKKWNKTLKNSLSVTSQRFEAVGDDLKSDWMGNSTNPGKVIMPISEIKSFGYGMGGEDEPSGFWVDCGFFKSLCVLPGLNREQSTAVSIAIARRFPEIGAKMAQKK